jgi:hypothetical protein
MERPGTTQHMEDRLDEGLSESFPASDPPAVHYSDDPPQQSPRAQPTAKRKPSGGHRSRPGKRKGRR